MKSNSTREYERVDKIFAPHSKLFRVENSFSVMQKAKLLHMDTQFGFQPSQWSREIYVEKFDRCKTFANDRRNPLTENGFDTTE